MPPGAPPSFGHTHRTQEEIYLCVRGAVALRLDDQVTELPAGASVLIPPGVVRAVRNESDEEAELVLLSVRVDDLRAEVEMVPDFWA